MAVSFGEYDRVAAEPVEHWRAAVGVAVDSEMIGAQCVYADQDDRSVTVRTECTRTAAAAATGADDEHEQHERAHDAIVLVRRARGVPTGSRRSRASRRSNANHYLPRPAMRLFICACSSFSFVFCSAVRICANSACACARATAMSASTDAASA